MLDLLLTRTGKQPTTSTDTTFTSALFSLGVQHLKEATAKVYPIVIQNPLGWERHDVVDVSILSSTVGRLDDLQVIDESGRPVRAQIHACMDAHNVHTSSPSTNVRLFLEVRIPPMGVATYYLRRASKEDRLEKKNLAEYVVTELIEVSFLFFCCFLLFFFSSIYSLGLLFFSLFYFDFFFFFTFGFFFLKTARSKDRVDVSHRAEEWVVAFVARAAARRGVCFVGGRRGSTEKEDRRRGKRWTRRCSALEISPRQD
jgi:hypothetical protein